MASAWNQHRANCIGTHSLPIKCAVPDEKCRRGAHLPFLGREPVGG